MTQFTDKVRSFIKENSIISPGEKIIIGLSGGADSVCLLNILNGLKEQYGITLYAVHVNHGIRGEQADEDERFSIELCRKCGIESTAYYYDVPTLSKEWHMTEEEAARRVRYEAFEKEYLRRKADKIATAHHKTDQAETILFRMCRGTGIKGMLGMAPVRGNIIRPLLCVTGREIREYLLDTGQEYRLDSTNECVDYDRNRIRHNVIPELERINDNAVGHIADMASQLSEVYEWFRINVRNTEKSFVKRNESSTEVNAAKLLSMHPAVAKEIVRDMIAGITNSLKDITAVHIEQVLGLLNMDSGKMIHLPYGITAYKDYDVIRLTKEKNDEDTAEEKTEYEISRDMLSDNGIDSIFYNVYLPDKKELCKRIRITADVGKYSGRNTDIPKNICTKWFDYGKMGDKLNIRRIASEDYFFIAGGRKKTMARYMIDEKIPRMYREKLLVAAEGRKVMWVIGGRASEEYFLKDSTDEVLMMNVVI